MNKEIESGHLNAPNIQMGRENVFIKLCLQPERANEHLALEHAISFSSTVTHPSQTDYRHNHSHAILLCNCKLRRWCVRQHIHRHYQNDCSSNVHDFQYQLRMSVE
jgi:hypothetical protein